MTYYNYIEHQGGKLVRRQAEAPEPCYAYHRWDTSTEPPTLVGHLRFWCMPMEAMPPFIIHEDRVMQLVNVHDVADSTYRSVFP
jgi:hypothetical protein